jgi:hypothetical protein
MNNEVIVLLFIGVLFCVSLMKYREGMDNLNPEQKSNEQQGTITNLHKEIEKLKSILSSEKLDMLDSNIVILSEETTKVRNNLPDKNVKKYRS